MNRSACMLLVALLALGACGFKGSLIRPAQIPEHEQKRAERLRKLDARDAKAAQSDAEWQEELKRRQQQQAATPSLRAQQPGGTGPIDSLIPPASQGQ